MQDNGPPGTEFDTGVCAMEFVVMFSGLPVPVFDLLLSNRLIIFQLYSPL